jgi:hypothetical protein
MLRLWPTPRASANENRQTKPTPSQEAGQHGMNLATTAALWPTPQIDSFRSRSGERKDEKGLDRMARDWPTPMANDGCKPSAGNRRTADLTHAAGMWMTPTARDHKDGATTLANTPVNGLLGRQVLVTPMAGSDTSDARRTLNPLFVEALMGWPTGWTGFASVATAWSLWLQRMRCELWLLNCWPTDEVTA